MGEAPPKHHSVASFIFIFVYFDQSFLFLSSEPLSFSPFFQVLDGKETPFSLGIRGTATLSVCFLFSFLSFFFYSFLFFSILFSLVLVRTQRLLYTLLSCFITLYIYTFVLYQAVVIDVPHESVPRLDLPSFIYIYIYIYISLIIFTLGL